MCHYLTGSNDSELLSDVIFNLNGEFYWLHISWNIK